jgi:16S rRNA (guanine966-N2)-methyltransferase
VNKKRAQNRTLRVIGGQWRGRKLQFADHPAIRPTADRVRETLFNWLQLRINNSRILDLYAGSGILSIEALSRGASFAAMVEQDQQISSFLSDTLHSFAQPSSYQVINTNAQDFVQSFAGAAFDLIFLDPPYHGSELPAALRHIDRSNILQPDGVIFFEAATALADADIPASLTRYREKRAGDVHYGLLIHRLEAQGVL